MRFAGTCSRYSNRAIPQLMSAAISHGLWLRSRKWAYQANVMKTLLPNSRPMVIASGGTFGIILDDSHGEDEDWIRGGIAYDEVRVWASAAARSAVLKEW